MKTKAKKRKSAHKTKKAHKASKPRVTVAQMKAKLQYAMERQKVLSNRVRQLQPLLNKCDEDKMHLMRQKTEHEREIDELQDQVDDINGELLQYQKKVSDLLYEPPAPASMDYLCADPDINECVPDDGAHLASGEFPWRDRKYSSMGECNKLCRRPTGLPPSSAVAPSMIPRLAPPPM